MTNIGNSSLLRAGSPDRFGYAWETYHELRPEYEEQFRYWTGSLEAKDWKGKRFLDVGCGMGRNSYWPLTDGAASGVAIDVDEKSLASAQNTLEKFENIKVRNLSAYDIDYQDEFDIVFSIGVIHHLAHPELALKKMYQAAKPGGRVLIWVYGLENNRWVVYGLSPLRKLLFSKLPIGFVHWLSLFPTAAIWLLLHLGVGKIKYFRLIRTFTFRHLRSIVFDQMLPKIAHYWPRETVKQLMEDAGLKDVQLTWVNEMSWTAIGTKS